MSGSTVTRGVFVDNGCPNSSFRELSEFVPRYPDSGVDLRWFSTGDSQTEKWSGAPIFIGHCSTEPCVSDRTAGTAKLKYHFNGPVVFSTALRITFSSARRACALGKPGRLTSRIVREDLPASGRSTISRLRKESAARAGSKVVPYPAATRLTRVSSVEACMEAGIA